MRRGGSCLTVEGKALGPLGSRSPVFIMLAILFTLFTNSSEFGPSDEVGTIITSCPRPTLLQQLVSFAAMRDVAEEEQLDWGVPATLGRQNTYRLQVKPAEQSEGDHAGENPHGNAAFSASSTGNDVNSANAPSQSRRRPHRRQRRKKKTESESLGEDVGTPVSLGTCGTKSRNGASSSGGSNLYSSDVGEHAETVFTTSQRLWAQLHMVEVAFSCGDNNLLHITERFLRCGNMYPIIYRCHLSQVQAAHEQALLDAPNTGLQKSCFWSCRSCGKAHDLVCESCMRCKRQSGPYKKLIFDQLLPETDYATSVLRLLHATHPEVTIHRIETQPHLDGGGRSSVAVYVSADAAPELVEKLNGNVFFDMDDDDDDDERTGGGVRVHYVYGSQRPWLWAFINMRKAQCKDPNKLPRGALVVVMETSKEKISGGTTTRAFRPTRTKRNFVFNE
ncbi:hypothetical protein TcG_02341 [Trypanosoma cruzi]|nr:hypothetical protein TcG_02341 [Trypanosoma cruzi]